MRISPVGNTPLCGIELHHFKMRYVMRSACCVDKCSRKVKGMLSGCSIRPDLGKGTQSNHTQYKDPFLHLRRCHLIAETLEVEN